MIIPIRTQVAIRRPPHVNQILIALNIVLFLLMNEALFGEALLGIRDRYLVFESAQPAFLQFFTYQFLHADIGHLLGNMLFLWVFGNAVNSKMGDVPYLLFYLAGGVFAAWGWAIFTPEQARLIGASGAIAAVTTAYLALFPRSRVTLLFWFFLIHIFELPAMIIIGLKIIVWDNIVAPSFGGSEMVAHSAHLSGYLFGFAAALAMLLVRALPRDQFDILALWSRWHRRREFATAMSDPAAAARAKYGKAARVPTSDPVEQAAEDHRLDEVSQMRERIGGLLAQRDLSGAAAEYEKLIAYDPRQCLSQHQQLEVARNFYRQGKFPQAAAAFERFLEGYPRSREATEVGLLLGIVYARDLRQYEAADKHLTQTMDSLQDSGRRAQCLQWLTKVRELLGKPVPEG